jgi:cytochrome c peroxidase
MGINDNPIDANVFNLFSGWNNSSTPARAAIARGQAIFNTKTFRINGVAGQDSQNFVGSCGTCHNTPNVGSYSVPEFFDIGVADAQRRTSDMPLYTFQNKVTGQTVQTSDPGRALVTGRWADMSEFKPANLRAVATRAPYFHDGSARTLNDVLNFYQRRFRVRFSQQERSDLLAFLNAL